MTAHGPLCPIDDPLTRACECSLIARVRADLRAKVEGLDAGWHTDPRHPERCPACVKADVLALFDEEAQS